MLWGTIADVAPLTDENRLLLNMGSSYLQNQKITALGRCWNQPGLPKKITAGNIGFIIAPRINASGRLGNAKSVEMFLCDRKQHADEIALQLAEENHNRQKMEQEIYQEAIKIIEQKNLANNKVIVVSSPGWHQGVIELFLQKLLKILQTLNFDYNRR